MVAPAEESVFRGTLEFLAKLGVYDVILPFLLVFVLVYGILEKTQILGTEKVEGHEFSRKNLNGMIALVMAFFVVASTRLVALINEVLANTVLLLLMAICFLMLAGSFHSGKKEFFLTGGWKTFFMVLMFIGILLIFLNSLGWLQFVYEHLFFRFSTTAVSSIVLVLIVVFIIFYVTGTFDKDKSEKKKKEED